MKLRNLSQVAIWLIKAVIILFLALGFCNVPENTILSVNYFAYIILYGLLCLSVWKFEKLWKCFTNTENKKGFWYALYLSASYVLLYNPIACCNTEVTSFNRIMGNALMANVDVVKRIGNFKLLFLLFIVAFVVFYILANYVLQQKYSDEDTKVVAFLDNLIVLANVNLFFACLSYFSTVSNNILLFSNNTTFLIFWLFIIASLYVILRLKEKVSSEQYAQLVIIVLSLSLPIYIFWAKCESLNMHIKELTFIQTALYIAMLCVIKYSGFRLLKWIRSQVHIFVICAGLLPLITSVSLELINVLNQYGIFIKEFRIFYVFSATGILLLLSLVLYCRKDTVMLCQKSDSRWKDFVYPIIVFGMACLSVQLPIQIRMNADIFETANSSILINDFFNFGELPLIEHFGAHMMTGVWGGLFYGIINSDTAGAIFSPYAIYGTAVLCLMFYYLVKYAWNEDMALFVALIFPFGSQWNYFGLGMLVCIALAYFIEKKSYKGALLFCAVLIWCAISRLDLGYAFDIAAIGALICYICVKKDKDAIKMLLKSLSGIVFAFGVIFIALCVVKKVNPVHRAHEFLMLCFSNINWAYSGIGDYSRAFFSWVYIVVPFFVAISLLYTVFSKNVRRNVGVKLWVTTLIFGFAYFANFSRGLVRHSMAENSATICIWSAYIFIALFIVCYKNNRKLFLPVLSALMAINLFSGYAFSTASVIDGAISGVTSYCNNFTSYDRKVQRIVWDAELQKTIEPYRIIVDKLLNDGETYIDFVNKSFVYSALNRRCPSYVAQSPIHISGEFTQKMYLEQIKDIPIVLMPIDENNFAISNCLDGIAHTYRYYKISEHIYRNYQPLCRCGDYFAVWCLKNRYNDYVNRLQELIKERDYTRQLLSCQNMVPVYCSLARDDDRLIIQSSEIDPQLCELQNCIDISGYAGKNMVVCVEYESNTPGLMQLFYTTDRGEGYTAEKVANANIDKNGIARFVIPVTKYTRIRLDTPEYSTVAIKNLRVSSECKLIGKGYDGPFEMPNGRCRYISNLHNYTLKHIPRIWAEYDTKHAIKNPLVIAQLNAINDTTFVFNRNRCGTSPNGHYMKLTATYSTNDDPQSADSVDATLKFGVYENGKFNEKYRYYVTFAKGLHRYLLRISTDYYWYFDNINAICIEKPQGLEISNISILEGD